MPAAGARLARGRKRLKALVRDEVRSLARGSVETLDRLAESNERVRRARPVLLASAARGGRSVRRARAVGPTLRPRTVLDEAYYRVLGAGRRVRARRSLTLVAAAVGQGLDVSVSLRGSRASTGAVTGLALRAPGEDSGPLLAVPATVVRDGASVRLAASLPPELFAAPGGTWLLEAVGARGAVTVAVPRRAALGHRWAPAGDLAAPWPARLECDRHGRLVVRAALPAGGAAGHEVAVGLTGVTVAWQGGAPGAGPDGPPVLGMVRHGTPADVTEVAASADRDGRRSARIGAAELLADPPAHWDLCVRGAGGAWVPLERPPGEYPPLAGFVRFEAFPVTTPGRPPLRAQIFYTPANTLGIRVEAAG